MDKIPRLTPDQRTNLVAYLDGELPETEAKSIEQVLAKSPAVQHDVDILSRTWELLDQLPRLAVSEEFTAHTLSVLQKDEAPKTMTLPAWVKGLPQERFRRGAIVGTWVVGLAASALLGFVITNRLIPDNSHELLVHLPVIEKLDLYSNADSIDFLKELDRRVGSFDESPKK